MPRGRFVSGRIETDGCKGLRVEARLSRASKGVPGSALLQPMESEDGKDWVSKGHHLLVGPGDFASMSITDARRLVRLEAEVPEGVPIRHLVVRVVRVE